MGESTLTGTGTEPERKRRKDYDGALIRLTIALAQGQRVNIPCFADELGVDRSTVYRWVLKMKGPLGLIIRDRCWVRQDCTALRRQ